MKKTISTILSMIVLISLTACSGKVNDNFTNVYNPETDHPYMFDSGMDGLYIAPSDSGYYYLDGSFLFYMDRGTMKPIVLCNKPDCKHMEEEDMQKVWKCNAFIGNASPLPLIQMYRDELYTISTIDSVNKKTVNRLIKISEDGTTREEIMDIYDAGKTIIHRGYVYSCYSGDGTNYGKVIRRKLVDPEGEEVIYTSILSSSTPTISAYGNYIIISDLGLYYTDKENLVSRLYTYNNKNKQLCQIGTDENDTELFVKQNGITDEKIMYIANNPNLDIDEFDGYTKTYISDFDGSNSKILADIPITNGKFITYLSADNNYYYGLHTNYLLDMEEQFDRQLIVYNKKFNVLCKTPLTGFAQFFSTVIGDENYMFFRYRQNEDKAQDEHLTTSIYYLDKSMLSQGEARLVKFHVSDVNTMKPTTLLR